MSEKSLPRVVRWTGTRRTGAVGLLSLGAVLGFLLLLALSHTTTTLIDAAVEFDLSVLAFVNGFARRSSAFDMLVWAISDSYTIQGGVMFTLIWWAWFAADETPAGMQKRGTVLSSLIALYSAAVLALVLRDALPFRPRPVTDPGLSFHVPYHPDSVVLSYESNSFPSGHAMVFFALATALCSISVRLGLLGVFHAVVVDSLPRMYLGFHYPTDIVAGAVLAIVTVSVVNAILRRGPLTQRLLAWSGRYPAAFYTLFFLCSVEVITQFSTVRTVLRLVAK